MVRADQRHPLFNQCVPLLNNPEVEPGSPGVLAVDGISEVGFNPAGTLTVVFTLRDASFSVDPADHVLILNDRYLDPASVAPQVLTFVADVQSGRNEFALYATDDARLPLRERYVAWAGVTTQTVQVVDSQGLPVDGAHVRFSIVDDLDVAEEGTTSGGQVTFSNVPPRTLIATAEDDLNRFGTAGALGNGATVTVEVIGFASPSQVPNNDFSLGTAGWDVLTGIVGGVVAVIPHEEEVGPSMSSAPGAPAGFRFPQTAPGFGGDDVDLLVGTGGEGPQRVSRSFEVQPGTASVTARYRFVTSEIPGGYFGSEYNDYFSVTLRSQAGSGRESEAASMNGLGLGAFSPDGATGWRTVTLPVSVDGDVIQIDAQVANVGDGAFDSQLIVDLVAEGSLSIAQATLQDRTPALGALTYLSLGNHPFMNGQTQVWDTVEVRGQPDDRVDDLILTVTGGPGITVAYGRLSDAARAALPSTFGSDGRIRLSMTGRAPLFEIPASGFFNSVTEERLTFKVFAYAASGADAERTAGSAFGLRYYDGANRFSRSGDPRDTIVGGDSWAQPSLYAFTQAILTHPASSDFMFNDFANMNGGLFPPHSGHRNGYEVDTSTPRINQGGTRDGVTAQRLLDFLNGPYGSGVEVIGVTYTPAIASALSGTTLADGRRAGAVVRNWEGHTHHIHLNLRRSWTPEGQFAASALGSRVGRAWSPRGPRDIVDALAKRDDAPTHPLRVSVVPNPFMGTEATLKISAPRASEASMTVYDVTGRLVVVSSEHALASGENDIGFDGSGLTPGVYVVVVRMNDGTPVRARFTVVR